MEELREVQSPKHPVPGIELLLVTSGYLVRMHNYHPIRINKSDFHLSLPRQKTRFVEFSEDLEGYYVYFTKEYVLQNQPEDILLKLEFINSFLFQYPIRLPLRVMERLLTGLQYICELDERSAGDRSLIDTYLSACILEVSRVIEVNDLDPYPAIPFRLVNNYYELLAQSDPKLPLAYYADSLHISFNHLNKSVKKVTGKTAIQLYNEMRFYEAKARLHTSGLTIAEIAIDLGFEGGAYFTRFFKKMSGGITPSGFRKKGH